MQHLARLGVAADVLLGEEYLVINREFEHALAAGDELKAADDVVIPAHNVVRHTGGTGPVVSGDAIFKGDFERFHDIPLGIG